MKSTTLSRVKDGGKFYLSTRSKVSYTRIKKEKDGIVYTSNNSNLSYKRSGSMGVFVKK